MQEGHTRVKEKTTGKSHAGAPEGATGDQKIRWLDCGWSEGLIRGRDAPGTKEDAPGFTAAAPRAPQNTPSLPQLARSPRSKLPDLNIQVRSCQKATPRVA